MRKILFYAIISCLAILLIACNEETIERSEEVVKLTPFEKVQEAKAALDLGDTENVMTNLYFPNRGLHDVVITWESNRPDIVSNTGQVTRPGEDEEDAVVEVVATLSLGTTTDTKVFYLKV